jgi:hypothetical protein
VFHVTDQTGHKLTDPSLPGFIERALVLFHRPVAAVHHVPRQRGRPGQPRCVGLRGARVHGARPPGPLVLHHLSDCGQRVPIGVGAGVDTQRPRRRRAVRDGHGRRRVRIERLVNAVVDARENVTGERNSVCMSEPVQGRVHTERRLHRDYESGPAPTPVDEGLFSMGERAATVRRPEIAGRSGGTPSSR